MPPSLSPCRVIVGGIGSVDQHMLTGESQPMEKGPGDLVFTSTLLLSGRLLIQVEKMGASTVSAQMVSLSTLCSRWPGNTIKPRPWGFGPR